MDKFVLLMLLSYADSIPYHEREMLSIDRTSKCVAVEVEEVSTAL
jgi:hypothetical protein